MPRARSQRGNRPHCRRPRRELARPRRRPRGASVDGREETTDPFAASLSESTNHRSKAPNQAHDAGGNRGILRPPRRTGSGTEDRTRIRDAVRTAGRGGAVGAGHRRRRQQGDEKAFSGGEHAARVARPRRSEAQAPHLDHRPVQRQGRERGRAVAAAARTPRWRSAAHARRTRGPAGVGRKTANVVLNTAFGEDTIAVDTHIFRVANRTGMAPGKDVRAVEDAAARCATAISPARAPLADPARALHLQGAQARVPGLPGARPVPLAGKTPAA